MKRNVIIWLLAVMQVAGLTWMLLSLENIRSTGTPLKLELRARDPYDPFRGNYLALNFADETVPNKGFKPKFRQEYWVELVTGSDGMARPARVSMNEQKDGNWLKVTNSGGEVKNDSGQIVLSFRYPFERYFMNEEGIKAMEKKLQAMQSDSSMRTWAEIRVKNGTAVITGIGMGKRPVPKPD